MTGIFWTIAWVLGLGSLAYHKTPRQLINISLIAGLLLTVLLSPLSWIGLCVLALFIILTLLPINIPAYRILLITAPLLKLIQNNLPKISKTERIALGSGTVWWDAELFSGKPNWARLLGTPAPKLSAEEQNFLDGPVETLCRMIDDWDIQLRQDLSPKIWKFLKDERFFALVIPKQYGGLEFSALGHSEILTKIAGRSLTVATTVAVPNSLGPAELLLKYGTTEQKEYYLPRLAEGIEIPCFALTGPEVGSDATAIPDIGVICKGEFEGREIVGIRLNWHKRYITLAPIATLLGLAFKLQDPDNLLGNKAELGITCALIPTHIPGITIGLRHKPLSASFQNGPTDGKNVFIPLDWIVGGPKMAGQGWRMLVECLSTGRAISLPASAAGMMKVLTFATGAYASIRYQFKQPISHFEGVEEVLARMMGNTYLTEAARTITANSIDQGEAPSVLGAIIKYHLTERVRKLAEDAMDIHGGKGIMLGPKNYIAQSYQNAPISITVEGANILTRCMIIFGQGAIKAHPYLLKELNLVKQLGNQQILEQFDEILVEHLQYTIRNAARAWWMSITQIIWFNQSFISVINRASSAFALISDVTLLILGGKLKHKERISARLGDLLSMMYLASCVVKRYEDEGSPLEDKVLIKWVVQDTLNVFWEKMNEILSNFPNRWIGLILRITIMPFGNRIKKPSDRLDHEVAQLLLSADSSRDRLIQGIYLTPDPNNKIGLLEIALQKTLAAKKEGASTELKKEAEKLAQEVISVDHFDPKYF